MVAVVLFAFVLGLVAGSFVTAVAHRVPRGTAIVAARSACPACGAQIHAYDNVPVVSWLLLRGRARCCGAAISPRYPLTELGLGLLFALTVAVSAHRHDSAAEVAIDLVFLTMLAATMGLFLGRAVAPAILVALLAGSLVGLALIARHGSKARKMAIPFGPFLALGGVVGMLVGDQLIDLYLG